MQIIKNGFIELVPKQMQIVVKVYYSWPQSKDSALFYFIAGLISLVYLFPQTRPVLKEVNMQIKQMPNKPWNYTIQSSGKLWSYCKVLCNCGLIVKYCGIVRLFRK